MKIASPPSLTQTIASSWETKSSQASRRIEDAATQFEALLVGQLLEPLTKMSESDSSSSSVLDMGKEQLAQAITAGGGLGLKKSILTSLNRV
jgi:Rod binding domain-containing protein